MLAENSRKRALVIARAAEDSRALEIVVLDMRPLMTLCDYFVIGHGRSLPHLEAIADSIEEEMQRHNIRVHHREGGKKGPWMVLDYLSVVVHIFSEEARRFYDLEHLWADAAAVNH